MTEARVSRVGLETLATNPNPEARVSRTAIEALVTNPNPEARVSRVGVEVLVISLPVELVGSSSGSTTVSATLDSPPLDLEATTAGTSSVVARLERVSDLAAIIAGASTVTGELPLIKELAGVISGQATVTSALNPPLVATTSGQAAVAAALTNIFTGEIAFPIPYLLGLGGVHTVELQGQSWGRPIMSGILAKIFDIATTTSGQATVTATLFTSAGTGFLAGTITGTSTVTAALQTFDGTNIELAGVITGTSTVNGDASAEFHAIQQSRFLYLYINVGVGFDDYDDPSARSDFVSWTGVDGQQNPSLLGQFLYQYNNIGVGFDDYDTYVGDVDFVSQTFPDGHNRDDFARYLYQYLCVIRGRQGYGKLAILPSYADRHEYVPRPEPPSNEFS